MNGKLGGKLLGFDIERDGIKIQTVRFDNPIKNTVVKKCLDNLLMFNGTNSVPTANYVEAAASLFFNYSSNAGRWGVFNYSALGDGTGNTDVNDTDLKNRITGFTSTRVSGSGYCGTYYDTTNDIIKERIAHSHTIETDFNIREIGYFNRYWGTDIYELSSRIALDAPVPVQTGDVFTSIYEIDIYLQGEELITDFFGMGAVRKRNAIKRAANGYGIDGQCSLPTINSSGTVQYPSNKGGAAPVFVPVYSQRNLLNNYFVDAVVYMVPNVSKVNQFTGHIPSFYCSDGDWYYSNGNVAQRLVKDYTPGNFYRDATYKLSPDWASGSNSIYGLIVNGSVYAFGTLDSSNVFTNAPISKSTLEEWTITTRQSWSTDLLQPSA